MSYRAKKTTRSSTSVELRCKERDPSPPPSYTSLYPNTVVKDFPSSEESTGNQSEAKETKIRKSNGSERKRQSSLGEEVYLDDVAQKIEKTNRERMRSGQPYKLKTFPVSLTQRSTSCESGTSSGFDKGVVERRMGNLPPFLSFPVPESPEYALVPHLDKSDVEEVLMDYYASQKCCESNSRFKPIKIIHTETIVTWHYHIESVFERRSTCKVVAPYSKSDFGQKKNDSKRPDIWDIKVDLPKNLEVVVKEKIPYTSSILECDSCIGVGHHFCSKCSRTGQVACRRCHGNGHSTLHETHYEMNQVTKHQEIRGCTRHETCRNCGGAGMEECCLCRGQGKWSCKRCSNSGKVEKYEQLIVTWKTKTGNYYSEEPKLHENIRTKFLWKCKGLPVYEESSKKIRPIPSNECLNKEMVKASKAFIELHKTNHTAKLGRQRMQSQTQVVNLIPITEVCGLTSSGEGIAWIIGTERFVYARELPGLNATWPCQLL
ncbi:unnamed protein product [Clavelina lepadiformis]|uniref:Uncharacterized protein n=1 Tax=Clavelina lepadiformis TaxID=159417 RepID=A0ABP0F851_CLALP